MRRAELVLPLALVLVKTTVATAILAVAWSLLDRGLARRSANSAELKLALADYRLEHGDFPHEDVLLDELKRVPRGARLLSRYPSERTGPTTFAGKHHLFVYEYRAAGATPSVAWIRDDVFLKPNVLQASALIWLVLSLCGGAWVVIRHHDPAVREA